ncbi:hypothetical protein G6F42_027813 [Rhizopus arrhizus]|nr:hypothetical protein G6F42_027813 [Rhizopus arrhizus]
MSRLHLAPLALDYLHGEVQKIPPIVVDERLGVIPAGAVVVSFAFGNWIVMDKKQNELMFAQITIILVFAKDSALIGSANRSSTSLSTDRVAQAIIQCTTLLFLPKDGALVVAYRGKLGITTNKCTSDLASPRLFIYMELPLTAFSQN